jgi:hypothetical protein
MALILSVISALVILFLFVIWVLWSIFMIASWKHAKNRGEYDNSKASPKYSHIEPTNPIPNPFYDVINVFNYRMNKFLLFYIRQHITNDVSIKQVNNQRNSRPNESIGDRIPKVIHNTVMDSLPNTHAPDSITSEDGGQPQTNRTK